MDACNNPDILRVIYFIKILIEIIMIIVPIGLIIMGLLDFSKSVVTNDENARKKNLNIFIKRIIFAVLLFAMPWIVRTFMHLLSTTGLDSDFVTCYENANSQKIKELDEIRKAEEEKEKDSSSGGNHGGTGGNFEDSSSGGSGNNSGSNSSGEKKDYTLFIGDSRTVGMCQSVSIGSNADCTIAEVGKGYQWLSSSDILGKIKSKLTEHPNSYVAINMGVNDVGNVNSYAKLYNDLANTYPKAKIVAISVNPVNDSKAKSYGYYVTDSQVVNFNNSLKSQLNNSIYYCDVYSKIINNFDTTDGLHYTNDTYKKIYDEIRKCLK